MKHRIETTTNPPKVAFETLLARFEHEETRVVLRSWYATLQSLHGQYPWIDSDMFDEFYLVTNTSFFDTLPTYTLEVDGRPLTHDDMVTQLHRVEDATKGKA